jgi:hypothetical protein
MTLKVWTSKFKMSSRPSATVSSIFSHFVVTESMAYFFPDKQGSKRVAQMKEQALKVAESQDLIKVTIYLPSKMLIEQLNLTVEGP